MRAFDLVRPDMAMPGMSGVTVLRAIRRNPATADPPVIVLTGRRDPTAAVEALAPGADDHVAKPFAFEQLVNRIDRALARARLPSGRALPRPDLVASLRAMSDQAMRLSAPSATSAAS